MVRYEECADYSSDDSSGSGASQDEIGEDEADEIGRSEKSVLTVTETNGSKKEAL